MPISLRVGDESLQPVKQSEDTLLWVKNLKPKLFGHLLVQQIASNYFINSANRVKPVQSLQSAIYFKKKIFIEENRKVLDKVRRY